MIEPNAPDAIKKYSKSQEFTTPEKQQTGFAHTLRRITRYINEKLILNELEQDNVGTPSKKNIDA